LYGRAGEDKATANDEHRPKSHRAHLEWTPSCMIHWASTIGPNTTRLFERIMNDKPHPWGIAAAWALFFWLRSIPRNEWKWRRIVRCLPGACRYRSVESILTHSLNRQPSSPSNALRSEGVARIFRSRIQSRACSLIRHACKSSGAVRREIGQNRSGGTRGHGMFGWIGRTPRNSNQRRNSRISLAGPGPIPGILAVPGRDGCVVDGDGH
jgi:hypothetical protein